MLLFLKRKLLENVGEITAELFGKWQTEDYVPPPVIDVSCFKLRL